VDVRQIVDAVLYLVRIGCQWRNIPHEFPPWGAVHYYYRRRRLDGSEHRGGFGDTDVRARIMRGARGEEAIIILIAMIAPMVH
jgi:transposase